MKQSDVLKYPDGKYLAEKGLFLTVRNHGRSRSWIYSRRLDGELITRGIGSAYELTLAMAKAAAEKFHASRLVGNAPSKESEPVQRKVKERIENRQAYASKERTFADCFMEAIESKGRTAKWRNAKHAQQWVNTVTTYALPILGSKRIEEITPKNILAVLNPIWETKTETAKRLRARLETIFDYFIRQGWRTPPNPAAWQANLEFDLPSPYRIQQVKHHGAPTVKELQTIIPELMQILIGKATVFGILTAARCQEKGCRPSRDQR